MTGEPARPRRRTATIRFRITALAALAVLSVLALAGVGLVLGQRWLLTEGVDETVTQQADVIARKVRTGAPIDAGDTLSDDLVVQVVGPDGRVVTASAPIAGLPPLPDPPAEASAALQTTRLPHEEARVRLLSRQVDGSVVHVAGDLGDVEEATTALTGTLLVAVPLATAALAIVVWWLVGRTLEPVEGIREQVARIGGTDLGRRVPEPRTHDEVARLARTMNQMLDRLERSAEAQRRFVADASHELRSPLTRIRTQLDVDLAHPAAADHVATSRSVREEAVNLQRLVDDLLLLARGDAGAVVLQRVPVDLDDVLLRHARQARRSGSVRVDTRGVSAVQVLGDPRHLDRAVGNLVENAVRHAQTTVTLSLAESVAGEAVLTVGDDGPGIPADRREAVFERFTRVDDARSPMHGGAGLGLAIARDIAERHGGTLTVDPEYRSGARFVLVLPAESSDQG